MRIAVATIAAFAATSAMLATSAALAHSPDPTHLPLGDGKLSSGPKVGYIWACHTDPNGGGAQVDGPWINKAAGTFDITRKAVVDGAVSWPHSFKITHFRQPARHHLERPAGLSDRHLPDPPLGRRLPLRPQSEFHPRSSRCRSLCRLNPSLRRGRAAPPARSACS